MTVGVNDDIPEERPHSYPVTPLEMILYHKGSPKELLSLLIFLVEIVILNIRLCKV